MASEETPKGSTPSQETSPTKGTKKKSPTVKILILAVLGILLLCCGIGTVGGIIYLTSDGEVTTTDPTGTTETQADYDETSYLGYEYNATEIEDNTDVQLAAYNMHSNLQTLEQYESELTQAAQSEDLDSFFDTYRSYNMTAALVISQAQGLSEYYSETGIDEMGSSPFVSQVYAKERSSWWYYVPIIGSLVKAKHQSIERARAGVYDYLKNQVESVDRDAFLHEYGLNSVEDLRDATDTKVEQLARDPELRAGIDWTAVVTDLGEQAVIATVEGYKIGSSASPVVAVGTNGAMRIFTDRSSAVGDTMPPGDERVTLAVSADIQAKIDETLGEAAGKPWSELSGSEKSSVADAMADAVSQGMATAEVVATAMDQPEQISLPADTYDILTVSQTSSPVIIEDLEVEQGTTIEVTVDYYGLSQYALDPEIASQLGFDATVAEGEFTADSCGDLGYSSDSSAADACKTAYDTCQANPYEYDDGYTECIGSDGGCWDIGRWEYVNENNCPIDAENNLDYTDERLQDDYEWFGSGNKMYCECIVQCREEHRVEKDCAGSFKTCCENL